MPAALDALRARLAELTDLSLLSHLAFWDQRTMMPPAGGADRANQFATLSRLHHERATADEVGEWLDALDAATAELDELDRDLVRLARRDYDRQKRVPATSPPSSPRPPPPGQDVWEAARAANDFTKFAPALERNVELARAYADCFDGHAGPYDALLADYDYGLTAERIQEVFGALGKALPPLVAELSARPQQPPLEPPVAAQERAVAAVLRALRRQRRQLARSTSPATRSPPTSASATAASPRATRMVSSSPCWPRCTSSATRSMTARSPRSSRGRASATGRRCRSTSPRASCGRTTSVATPPSRACSPKSCRPPASRPTRRAVHATLTAVRPSLIRVSADETTYPLHIVLRFELERALVEGTLSVADLPAAWNDGMQRLLGVTVPSDADGVLQDVHWSSGAFGYFPSYALGCLIAAQLWETLESELGAQDDALAAGDVEAIAAWLGDKVHRHGRRLDTEPIVESATGRGLDPAPFLRHLGSR